MSSNRIHITGTSGFIGGCLVEKLKDQGHDVLNTRVELSRPGEIATALDAMNPDCIVHAAAMSRLGECEADPARAMTINAVATAAIAQWCADHNRQMIFLSTDQVFDGTRGMLTENDSPNPIHAYGRSKLVAEAAVAEIAPAATILRLALVCGSSAAGNRSPSETLVRDLQQGRRPALFADEYRSPIHVDDVVSAITELMDRPHAGLLHLGGPQRLNRVEFGGIIARSFGLDGSLIDPAMQADIDTGCPRPADVSLNSDLARSILHRPPRPLAEAFTADREV